MPERNAKIVYRGRVLGFENYLEECEFAGNTVVDLHYFPRVIFDASASKRG